MKSACHTNPRDLNSTSSPRLHRLAMVARIYNASSIPTVRQKAEQETPRTLADQLIWHLQWPTKA